MPLIVMNNGLQDPPDQGAGDSVCTPRRLPELGNYLLLSCIPYAKIVNTRLADYAAYTTDGS